MTDQPTASTPVTPSTPASFASASPPNTPLAALDALLADVRAAMPDRASIAARLEALRAQLATTADATDAAPPSGEAVPPATEFDPGVLNSQQARFISHIVHELRTPLTSIRGYADMLPHLGPLNEQQTQFLKTIRTNVRRLEGLLTDVSDTAKLRGGTLRLNPKMDMVKNIAATLERDAGPLAESFGRALVVDVPSGLPLLTTDGDLLTRALFKLLENALRYHPEDASGGQATLRASADDTHVLLVVEDDGIGMSDDERAQLGTLFWRGDHDAVRAHKGSGMGAAVAFGLLRELDATWQVAAAPSGKGTAVTVRLPAMR